MSTEAKEVIPAATVIKSNPPVVKGAIVDFNEGFDLFDSAMTQQYL